MRVQVTSRSMLETLGVGSVWRSFWEGLGLGAFAAILALSGLALVAGCTVDINHRLPVDRSIDVNVSVDVDECVYCLPRECGRCEHTDGTRCDGCVPACLGGRYLTCTPMGPECKNDAPTGRIDVPVICVPAGDGGA